MAQSIEASDPDLGLFIESLRGDSSRKVLVVVDNAEITPAEQPELNDLVRYRHPHLHVVASSRADRTRSLYAHWIREVQSDRSGLILMPDPDIDGELLATRIPRQMPVDMCVGRGWLTDCEGDRIIHVAN